jgi:trehalose-phosphatase
MEYLFSNWKNLKEKLQGRHMFLFLDYDGTLTPIVEKPEKANICLRTKELLERLSECSDCKVAIISGRSLKDIKNKVGIKNIIYSGNYGLQIEGRRIKFEATTSQRYKNILEQIKKELTKKLSPIKGILIEDKGLSLSLHYRLVNKKQVPFVKTAFHEVTIPHLVRNKIKVKAGKKVLEVRPAVEWDKGKIALWLLARQQAKLVNKKIIPIYIGDDSTDEDAFKALKNKGLIIFVGNPKPSHAKYYLKNTKEVFELLNKILAIRNGKKYLGINKSQRTI